MGLPAAAPLPARRRRKRLTTRDRLSAALQACLSATTSQLLGSDQLWSTFLTESMQHTGQCTA